MVTGNKQTSTQTTTSGPWPPAQKYLEGAMQKAGNWIEKGKGFNPYPGQTWTPFSGQTVTGLGQIEQMAGQPNPFYAGSNGFTQGLIGGNYNLDQSGYQNLMGKDPLAIAQYGTGIASGAEGIGTEADYRTMFDQVNPLFDQVVNRQAGQIGDDVARQFGGASFGSAASTGALVDQIGDFRNRMTSENFYNNQNLKRGLLGDITGLQGQNIQNRLAAAGALSGEQQQAFANQYGLQQSMSGLSQQDIANRMGGVGMADQVYQSQYLPAERMLGVGAAHEAKAGEQLQAEMDKFNIKQQAPWNRLAAAYPYFSGTGGSTQQTTTEQPTDPFGKIIGAGLLATQGFSSGGLFNQGGNLFRRDQEGRMY